MARLWILLLFGAAVLPGCGTSQKPPAYPPQDVPAVSNQSSVGSQILPSILPPW